jgi:hypothetical protein
MRSLVLIVEMLLIIAGLVVTVGAVLYAVSWMLLLAVQFFPVIGKRNRHARWDELTKRSGRQ